MAGNANAIVAVAAAIAIIAVAAAIVSYVNQASTVTVATPYAMLSASRH